MEEEEIERESVFSVFSAALVVLSVPLVVLLVFSLLFCVCCVGCVGSSVSGSFVSRALCGGASTGDGQGPLSVCVLVSAEGDVSLLLSEYLDLSALALLCADRSLRASTLAACLLGVSGRRFSLL